MLHIKYKKLDEECVIPTQGTEFSAGYDLSSVEEVIIPPLERKLVKTGLSLEIPSRYYGRIAPRSGLAYKNGIHVMAGVIDSDYRGEIGVILYNSDKHREFKINKKDRIAQIIFELHHNAFFIEQSEFLTDTERGDGGFGSTGLQ